MSKNKKNVLYAKKRISWRAYVMHEFISWVSDIGKNGGLFLSGRCSGKTDFLFETEE